jgi:hypothetical protein
MKQPQAEFALCESLLTLRGQRERGGNAASRRPEQRPPSFGGAPRAEPQWRCKRKIITE